MSLQIIANSRNISRRRSTLAFTVNFAANYANPGPNYLDPTTATGGIGSPRVGGLLDPGLIAQGKLLARIAGGAYNPFIAAGVAYTPSITINPNATSWANAIILGLVSSAGAQPANGTAFNGSFVLEIEAPNGKI